MARLLNKRMCSRKDHSLPSFAASPAPRLWATSLSLHILPAQERLLHPPALTGLLLPGALEVVRGRNPSKLAQRKQEQPSAGEGRAGLLPSILSPRSLPLGSACLPEAPVGCPGSEIQCPTGLLVLALSSSRPLSTTFQLSFSQLTDLTLGPLCSVPAEVGLLPSYPLISQ